MIYQLNTKHYLVHFLAVFARAQQHVNEFLIAYILKDDSENEYIWDNELIPFEEFLKAKKLSIETSLFSGNYELFVYFVDLDSNIEISNKQGLSINLQTVKDFPLFNNQLIPKGTKYYSKKIVSHKISDVYFLIFAVLSTLVAIFEILSFFLK